MSLINSISNAINKSLKTDLSDLFKQNMITDLTDNLVENFQLDEEKVEQVLRDFFEEYIPKYMEKYTDENFGKVRTKKAPKRVGLNGKGRLTSYLMYCAKIKDELKVKGLSQTDIAKEAGRLWRELPDSEKEQWKNKANEANEKNGLSPSKSPKTKTTKPRTKNIQEKQTKPRSKKTEKQTKSTNKKQTKKSSKKKSVQIELDPDTQKFYVIRDDGIKFIVKSASEKTIVTGKIENGKTLSLNEEEQAIAKIDGFTVELNPEYAENDDYDFEEKIESDDNDSDSDYLE